MANIDPFEQALIEEGVIGTPLEAIARSTRMRESGGNINAVSNRGARGLMQVMPGTFGDMADPGWDINNPMHNTRAGIRYLKKAYEASGGDAKLTGAYYYGGPGGMAKAKQNIAVSDPKNPGYPTTLEYGRRLADDVAKFLLPSASASTLPPDTQPQPQAGSQMTTPEISPQVANTPTVLKQALASMQGNVNNPNRSMISPEAIASLQGGREVKARMLPIALGALMSSNAGANSFGRVMAPEAMEAFGPTRVGTSIITPGGEYIQGTGSQSSSYFTPVQTGKGIMVFNNRTGQMEPAIGADGKPIVGSQSDPTLQGELAGAKESGKLEGGTLKSRQLDAPKALRDAEYTIGLVDEIINHPGREMATGMSRMTGAHLIPGTDAMDFEIKMRQLKGRQFLEAFEALKGGGQITEMEGKKATDAMSAMDAAGSEEAFLDAAKRFREVMDLAVQRAKMRIDGVEPRGNEASYTGGGGGLTPEEQAELEELRKWRRGGQ